MVRSTSQLQRRKLLKLIAAAPLSQISGTGFLLSACGGGTTSPLIPPLTNPQPKPNGSITAMTASITDNIVGKIGTNFMGLSYEKSSLSMPRFSAANNNLVALFKQLGTSILRIGGNSVDITHWNADGLGTTSLQVSKKDVDRLADFLKATDWQVLYGVNLATSTPQAAADEVAYVAQALGDRLCGIEIGNEPDNYTTKHKFPSPPPFASWTLEAFEQQWELFRNAIIRTSPNVLITAPGTGGSISEWAIPFAEHFGKSQISMLSHHYYRANGNAPTSDIPLLISPDPELGSEMEQLHEAANNLEIPFRITETNSFYNGGAPGVSNSYASALWVIDHLFGIASAGANGANLHSGSGASYSPIQDNKGIVTKVCPEYYGLFMFSMAGAGDLKEINLENNGLNFNAYTIDNDKKQAVVLVNKDSSQNVSLTLTVQNTISSASLIQLSGPSLASDTGVTIQGSSVSTQGIFQPQSAYNLPISTHQLFCYIPAQSAALVRIN